MRIRFHLITVIISMTFLVPAPSQAVDQGLVDEFSALMQNMVDHVTEIENSYNIALTGNIARTRRLEVFSAGLPELEAFEQLALPRSDPNSGVIVVLIDAVRAGEPTDDAMKSLLLEIRVRSVILECATSGIGSEIVAEYVRRESATFVADRGNFFHPEFDESSLTDEDIVHIYFAGFGLIVLVNMEGGIDASNQLYDESTELRPYFAQQLTFRGADLDIGGMPLLEAVLFDPAITIPAREVLYGVLAGKMIAPAGQFGNELQFTTPWKEIIAEWAADHIATGERLDARAALPFYGVQFGQEDLGPESLLGIIGPPAYPHIATLLQSGVPMQQVCGLEALRWVDMGRYPDEAETLFALAEPLMGSNDFVLAALSMNAYEADALYTGEPYDESRRDRLEANLPILIGLLNLALEDESIDYLSTTAWLDIFAEGSLADQLVGCMPMISRVVVADWERRQMGEQVMFPEGEIEIISYFLPSHIEYFESTSDAALGFLNGELSAEGDDSNGEGVNPFRVWTYVEYLQAAKSGGATLDDNWMSALVRLRAWSESGAPLVRGDELKEALDGLLM